MLKPNRHYADLRESYLFSIIAEKVRSYEAARPGVKLYRMGIGDVSLPLCEAVIEALHDGVNDQANKATFHGYMPECGDPALRQIIAGHYAKRGVRLSPEEVFISSGASDEMSDLLDLFERDCAALVMEPAYPVYVESNVLAGRRIVHLDACAENGFLPMPNPDIDGDILYICSPANPTGAVFSRDQLQAWVDFANERQAVILFDAAYEAFIEEDTLPHSIFEIDGAKTCAIEICSLSKTAGFTGTRLGYTVVPETLEREGMSLHHMWTRNRISKTNGISYILQKGAAAVFTEKGQRQIKANIQVYKRNARVLMDALDGLGIWYCGGKNAPYLWLRCPDGMGSWEFFDTLLENTQIVGTPGAGFGKCGEGFFRFSTFGSPEDTAEAARRLKAWLR